MNILIAIGGRKYSKPTLDLGMKVSNSFEASTTIAYVGKKISQFSEKDVSIVHQNLDERQLYRPGVRTLEWAYNFLKSKEYIQEEKVTTFNDYLLIDEEQSRMRKAIEIAEQFAKANKLAVEIVTVLENKSSDDKLKKILERTEEKFSNAGIKNTATVLEGNVVKKVVENAGDDSIIMLGVSPKNPIMKYFFGSKPISIAAECNCPVLVAK